MEIEKYLKNLKYIVPEKDGISYSTKFLETKEFLEIEKNYKFDLIPCEILKNFKVYSIRDKEILVVNADIAHYQIYKLREDLNRYLELSYGAKNNNQLTNFMSFDELSFINTSFEIISYKISLDIPDDLADEYSVKDGEQYLIFSSEDDYNEYKKLDQRSVFYNVNPFGIKLLEKKGYLINKLAEKLPIPLKELDFTIESLAKIDKIIIEKKNISQHFFYSIYLELTVYFGYCLASIDENVKLVLVNNTSAIEPEIQNELNGVEKSLSIYIYKNYINSQQVVRRLKYLFMMLKDELVNY